MSCMIGHNLENQVYIDFESPINVMSIRHYKKIMSQKLESRQKPSNPCKKSNFVGRVRGLKVFVGNFTYECDFMILEDTTSIIDHHLREIAFKKPFIEETGLAYNKEEGTIVFWENNEKITFKMPHRMELFEHIDLKDMSTDPMPPFVLENKNEHEKVYYSNSLIRGPKYKQNESVSKEIQRLMKLERDVGIKRLLDDLEVTASKVYVTIAKQNLVLFSLVYNVVPPPYTGNFMPPKDLSFSGLEEFVNEPIVSEPTVKKFVVETSEAKANSEDEAESKPKIKKKTVKPSFAKIEFVKFKEKVKSPRKTTVKQVPRKNNMYSADLKNIVPKGDLIWLFAKATYDEFKLWHRRLGHLNFKTMNKLVMGNLVRGLPSKLFENDETRVACQKEAVNTTCYMQNKVLVVKPHNKTPYELFHGRTPALSFMRPFGCPVTILNIKDHIEKFDGKANEGFLIGYSFNSKVFRVFNSKTRIMEENLHIRFNENTPNVVGRGPDWLFDIDVLTRTMNYEAIVAGTESNNFAGLKANDNAGQARKEKAHVNDYILLSLWTADLPFPQQSKSSQDDRFQPSSDHRKKVDEDPRQESKCKDQKKEDNVNITNTVNAAGTNEVNTIGAKINNELPFDLKMPALEDIKTFNFSSDHKDNDEMADMNNLDTTIQVSPNTTTRIHKDHLFDQVIEDMHSTTQTRNMLKSLEDNGFVTTIHQRTNHKDLQNCLFACFLSHEELKKDERGIVIRNKARLVSQGHTQVEGIDYDKIFAPVARIEAIRLFLAYASFKDFTVYYMDVKSSFLYGKIKKEVYVCQQPGFEDPDFPDKVYKVEKALYGLHQAPRACQDKYVKEILKKYGFTGVKNASTPMETQKPLLKDEDGEKVDVHMYRSMIGSLMYLTSSRLDIMFALCACTRYQVNPKVSHLHAVKRIFSKQFWATVKAKTVTGEVQLQALVDGKNVIITESTVRRDLQLKDDEGVDCLPNAAIFEQLTLMGKTQRKDSALPQTSGPTTNIADKAVNDEMDKSLVRVVTAASSLEVEQDSGNINKTQSQATPNEPGSQGTSSGGGPRCQETMRDTITQTRSKNVSKFSIDSLLAGVNTRRSDEDSLKLKELMELCTNIQNMVLDLETIKTTQAMEIKSLKRKVLRRIKASLGDDASKQGRIIDDIDADEGITLVDETAENQRRFNDQEDAKITATTTTATIDDITLAKALIEIKSAKPKADKVVIQEPEQGTATTTLTTTAATTITAASTRPKAKGLVIHEHEQAHTPTISSQQPSKVKVHDKGKGKMVEPEPVKKLSKKDQLMLDEELAFKLQAEEEKEEEERLAREKAQQIKEVNIAWDDIQAKIDADYQLAQRLAEEKRNRPPTRAQQRSIMCTCTYLENMEGWKPKSLKNKSFANIRELFHKAIKRVNTFVDYRTELVLECLKEAEAEVTEGSLKRAGEELEQENAKK
nr:hypothetical protein [Tanacetum cinerariifolium]